MGKKVFLYLLPLFLATWVFMAFPDPVEAAQPTVRTDPAQEAWGTTALLKGRVTAINSSPQGPGIIEYGFIWDTVSRGAPGNIAPAQSGYAGKWATTTSVSYASLEYATPVGTFPEATTIYYRACAKNADNNWGYGEEQVFLTAPAIPVRTSPINEDFVMGNSISFQWNSVPGATSYVLHVRKGDVIPFFDQVLGNALSHTVPGFVNDGQIYRWSVTARNANTWAYEVPLWTFFNGPYPPPSVATIFPPTNVEATTAILNGKLTWTQGPAITRRGFVWDTVSRGDPGNIPAAQSAYANRWGENGSFGSGNYSHTIEVPAGTAVFYRAFARNDQQVWAYGPEFNFITNPPVPVPVCPIEGQDCTMNHSTVRFQWNAAQSANSYSIHIQQIGERTPFHIQDVGNQTIVDVAGKFPNDGSRFQWRVRAGNQFGTGNWSEWKAFTNGSPTAPAASPILQLPREGERFPGTDVPLSWKEVSGASKYQIYVDDKPDFAQRREQSHETTGTSFTLRAQSLQNEKKDGTTYYWRVRAGNAVGWGPWSQVRSFVIVPR